DIDGKMAIILWEKYKRFKDFHSLKLLLEYNREDVCNLRILREKLEKSF
ncbi:MAG: ribonuclease H-like domain-containing protein, partial [Clostridia bacterium]|nr:ribonuclease H-like domain-containing protein [Clostridia bacterium]